MEQAKRVAAEYSEKHKLRLSINAPQSMAELNRWIKEGIEDHLHLASDGTPLKTIMALDAARAGITDKRKTEIRQIAERHMQGDNEPRWWNDQNEVNYFERCVFEISNRNAIKEIDRQKSSVRELVRMLADDLREDVKAIHAMNLESRESRWLALRLAKRGKTKDKEIKYNSLDQIAKAMGEHRQAIHRLEVKMHSRKDVSDFLESRGVPDRVARGVTKRKKVS